jgi:hypothetical protein
MSDCKHENAQWRLTGCNEDGWHCDDCNAKIGFSPRHDRELVLSKVETILFWLHEQDFIYVSNSDQGDFWSTQVANRCVAENRYDQSSIVMFLVGLDCDDHHVKYWQDKAAKVTS